MLKLGQYWSNYLITQPETGMSYQIARVKLHDGRSFERVVIVGNVVCEVDRSETIPFNEEEIAEIVVRGDEWNKLR